MDGLTGLLASCSLTQLMKGSTGSVGGGAPRGMFRKLKPEDFDLLCEEETLDLEDDEEMTGAAEGNVGGFSDTKIFGFSSGTGTVAAGI